MSHSEIDAIVRDAIESRNAFDPDYDRITSLEIVRTNRPFGETHVYVHAVVMTTVDELDSDRRTPVETLEIIVRDNDVVSVERLSLHLI